MHCGRLILEDRRARLLPLPILLALDFCRRGQARMVNEIVRGRLKKKDERREKKPGADQRQKRIFALDARHMRSEVFYPTG